MRSNPHRRHRFFPATLVATLLAILPACHQGEPPTPPRLPARSGSADIGGNAVGILQARSIRVQDGDSFVARLSNGNSRTIRLSGVDAPERTQPLADQSRQNLHRLLDNRELSVRVAKEDAFGRAVAQVFVLGEGAPLDAGLAQLESGMAWFFRRYRNDLPAAERDRYAEAEQAARQSKRGLWQTRKPEPPWDFRQRQQQAGNRSARP